MEEARLWRARHSDTLPAREQQYLDAVFALANRASRLRRTAAVGTIGFLSLVIAGGAVALVQIHHAQERAVQEAAVATREAERARAAEAEVQKQLDVIRSEQDARTRAQAEVKRGKLDLASANAQLELALEKAEQESKHAREAADAARKSADNLQKANVKLEKLLADERARAERLERERRKITNELR
jgi:hypothetical protein